MRCVRRFALSRAWLPRQDEKWRRDPAEAHSATFAGEAEDGRPQHEVVALGEVLRLCGGLRVELRRRDDVADPLGEVGGRSCVPREHRVRIGERGEPRLRVVRLTDGDGAAGRQSTDRLLNARDS